MLNEDITLLLNEAKKGEKKICIFGCGFLLHKFSIPFLENLGINIDILCDNNKELWGKELYKGIVCEPPYNLVEYKENIICFIMLRADYLEKVYVQVKSMGIEDVVTFADIVSSDLAFNYFFDEVIIKDTVVYSCIVGDYDTIQKPDVIMPHCDYVLFGDREPECDIQPYKYVDIEEYLPVTDLDNTRKNRYIKLHPHFLFENYKYSIYHDGNIKIKKDLSEIIQKLNSTKTRVATAGTSYSLNIYDEAIRCIIGERDNIDTIKKQVKKYYYDGMPKSFPTFFCNVLIREHNNPICRRIMDEWWSEIELFSRRDQISFPYVIWKNGFDERDVYRINTEYVCTCEYWEFIHDHKVNRNTGIKFG